MKKSLIILALLASSAAFAFSGAEPVPPQVETVHSEMNEFGTMEEASGAEDYASGDDGPATSCPKGKKC